MQHHEKNHHEKQPYRVLLVEDEPGDVALIRLQLNEKDADSFQLHVCQRLEQALEQLGSDEEAAPDVILLDLNLPDSAGLITLQQLRDQVAEVPVVVLTGDSDRSLIDQALKFGAQDFLLKGADGHTLRKAIRYAIVRHERDETARMAEAVFNITNTGIAMLDARFRVQRMNPSLRRLTGRGDETSADLLMSLPCLVASGSWDRLLEQLQAQGHCKGELHCHHPEGEEITLAVRGHAIYRSDSSVSGYVMVFDDITARKQAEEKLAYQATHDSLTGLPNRALFYDRLQQSVFESQRYQTPFALLYMDLDGFKSVNDTWGHQAGDQLLMQVAERLRRSVRDSDSVARLAGDEFAVIIRHCPEHAVALQVADKLLNALECIFPLGIADVQISASIGIAFCPDDAQESDALMHAADQAMYGAKRGGKSRCVLYRENEV